MSSSAVRAKKHEPPMDAELQSKLVAKFGTKLMKRGFTALPVLVQMHYRYVPGVAYEQKVVNEETGEVTSVEAYWHMTPTEYAIMTAIWSYWWEHKNNPWPSVAQIASQVDKSERQVRRYLTRLKDKGFMFSLEQYNGEGKQISNRYDFSPFLRRLITYLDAMEGPAQPVETTARDDKNGRESVTEEAGSGSQKCQANEDLAETEILKEETNSSSGSAANAKKVGGGATIRNIDSNRKKTELKTKRYDKDSEGNQANETETKTKGSHQERPGAAAPASGKGTSQAAKPRLPMYLESIVLEIAQSFNEVKVPSASTRAAALYERALAAGCPDEYVFVEWMEYPRQTTADRLRAGQIKRRNQDGSPAAMPLFFHLLEERVDLMEAQQASYEEEQQRLDAQQAELERNLAATRIQGAENAVETKVEETPVYLQQVGEILTASSDDNHEEYLEISLDLAIAIYSFCLSYYKGFSETTYLSFIASAMEQIGERYNMQQFFGILLESLELEVIGDENGYQVCPVGMAVSDDAGQEDGDGGEQS